MAIEELGVADAKRRFSELIDRVGRGEHFVVSRRGKPAVALISPEEVGDQFREKRPSGVAAFVGVLAEDGDVLEEITREAYQNRGKARDRAAVEID